MSLRPARSYPRPTIPALTCSRCRTTDALRSASVTSRPSAPYRETLGVMPTRWLTIQYRSGLSAIPKSRSGLIPTPPHVIIK